MNTLAAYGCAEVNSIRNESTFTRWELGRVLLFTVLLSFVSLFSAFGQDENSADIRYSLSPMLSATAWSSDLGLKDGVFYGGKLGIDFGPLISLEASYLTSGHLWTDFSEIGLLDTAGSAVGDQRVKVRRFAGDLLIRWPSDRFAPFVKVGGGAIRFVPESGDRTERIDVKVGGGFDYVFSGRVRARTWVEMNRFRLDRYSLAPGGIAGGQYPIDPEADKARNQFSVGMSLDYALGQGRFRAVKTGERLHPFSVLELEPMVGRLDFDDPGMSIVTVVGALVGGELNPWVGWGLYYWHAMESDLSDTRPLQIYGGEARFKLASTAGPQPYVTIGAGQLDFQSGYTDSDSTRPADKTALILGAGVRAELFRGLQLNVSARDLMHGAERLDRVSGTDDISHNWLISGALVFGIGGDKDFKRPPAVPRPVPLGSREDSKQQSAAEVERRSDGSVAPASEQSSEAETPSQAGYVSEKSVLVPVPLEGEIYIRYGKTPGEAGKVASVSKTLVSEDTTVTRPPTSTPEMTSEISRHELDSLIDALRADISAMLSTGAEKPEGEIGGPTRDVTVPAPSDDSTVAALRRELAASEQERKRLDSLLHVSVQKAGPAQDSVAEQRVQQTIVEQVAAALAAKPEQAEKEITQADLQAMMASLTARMDSAAVQRSAADSARLRDQLQLEIIRQTKSQEEFQQALREFMIRYGERQEARTEMPPAIIVTQPAPAPQVIESGEPTTVVVKPDTQYAVVPDTTSRPVSSLPTPGPGVEETLVERDFIDLRPTGYTGFGLEQPKQFVLGGRLDIGPITAKKEQFRLVPEFALGLGGGGVSVMAAMNVEYAITEFEAGDYLIVPYARLGAGVLGFGGDIADKDTEGVLNFTYGFSFDFGDAGLLRGAGNPVVFIEHQIIDLFDVNRIALGMQWSR